MFVPMKATEWGPAEGMSKLNPDRAARLKREETKGRDFNIINGTTDFRDHNLKRAFKGNSANHQSTGDIRDHWKDKL